jgi:hypothetical protein
VSDKVDFRHNDVKDEKTKEEHRNDPFASVALLTKVAAALAAFAERFKDGNLSLFSEVCESKDIWDATNYARLWPEAHHDKINHLLQDALAHISDAHYMVEGVYCLGPGEEGKRYKTVFPNVVKDIQFALSLVREALELLHDYINDLLEENK